MSDARERMARALWDTQAGPYAWQAVDGDERADYLEAADAALAVARELVKEAVPSIMIGWTRSPREDGHNAARVAALRALGETE